MGKKHRRAKGRGISTKVARKGPPNPEVKMKKAAVQTGSDIGNYPRSGIQYPKKKKNSKLTHRNWGLADHPGFH